MTLWRLGGAALLVALWFAAWGAGARKLRPAAPAAPLPLLALEALGFTLLATLWFASLGHGGWYILFPTLGLFVEGPVRRRHAPDAPWLPGTLLGALRLTVAGGILAFLL